MKDKRIFFQKMQISFHQGIYNKDKLSVINDFEES